MILKICYSEKTLVSVEQVNSPLYAVEGFFNACIMHYNGIGIPYGNIRYMNDQ